MTLTVHGESVKITTPPAETRNSADPMEVEVDQATQLALPSDTEIPPGRHDQNGDENMSTEQDVILDT